MPKSSIQLFLVIACICLWTGCENKRQQRFSAEKLRFVPSERAAVFRLRDEDGGGSVRYLAVSGLPIDYTAGLEAYLQKHAKTITGGLAIVDSSHKTYLQQPEANSKSDHLYLVFRRPRAPGEVDTSWGTYLPYRGASILLESQLPASLTTNQCIEASFDSFSVTYTDRRMRSLGRYNSGP